MEDHGVPSVVATSDDHWASERLLHEAASVLLPGGPEQIDVSDTDSTTGLVTMAQAEAVLGPLLAALPETAADLREQTLAQHERTMLWCLELELRLLEIKEWFDAAGGVEFRVLKGPAVAHLDEADPSLRTFADLDLLIHAPDMDRAIAVLTAHGVERRIPQRRPGFDRRFVKGVGMRGADGIEVDLHRTLCVGALGFRIPLDDLFDDPEHFVVGGQTFAAMRLEHRALHAAYHAILGTAHPPLKTLRDLAGYLTHPALTPDVLAAEARRWGGETVLGEALHVAFETLHFEAPTWQAWLTDFAPDEGELSLIEQTRDEDPRSPVDLPVLAELGWQDRAAFLWAVAVPSREVLEREGQSRWQRLRSQSRKLRRQLSSSSVVGQVLTTVLAGILVQALLWFRGDSAAHLIGGAALTTFIGVTVPKGWLRHLDAWAELVILGVVLGVSWVSEHTIVGPFDPIDIAFTVTGSFLSLAYLPDWFDADRSERRRLRITAVALAVLSLTLRYVVGFGKA